MVINLSSQHSVANRFVAQMRNVKYQDNRLLFRNNMVRLGQIFAYEISKTLPYSELEVETPLGLSRIHVPDAKIVLCTILRAGLPLHEGLLQYFEDADCAFIAAYRKHDKSGGFDINLEYITCPDLTDATLIIADPMLATGASIEKAMESLSEYGAYKDLHIVSIIASTHGISHIERLFPKAHIWVAAEDEELTAKSYIVPGLGDAGDLAYGKKLQD
ncbi:MAG: uracil phosphoribosyltransferase [Saprospiraceae bacterium]|jgi:uracil phosphoribosyltransferase|nr:uracil phosphoribosyltransferase [Saprospiraceae bacterium]